MGDIADMHVEAYAAGLDPNEMDGADWADFYYEQAETEPPDADEISCSFRVFVTSEILEAAKEGEAFTDTIHRLWPQVSKAEAAAFEQFLNKINGFSEE